MTGDWKGFYKEVTKKKDLAIPILTIFMDGRILGSLKGDMSAPDVEGFTSDFIKLTMVVKDGQTQIEYSGALDAMKIIKGTWKNLKGNTRAQTFELNLVTGETENFPSKPTKVKMEPVKDAVSKDIEGSWKGHFVQRGRKNDMQFDNLSLLVSGEVTGRGLDPTGEFTIIGNWTPNSGDVNFKKSYKNKEITYKGVLSDSKIVGKWKTKIGPEADFELEYQGVKLDLKRKAGSWAGFYFDKTKKIPMKLDNMEISTEGAVKGSGSDESGKFTIQGQANGIGYVELKIKYPKKEIEFKGNLVNDRISGSYEAPGGLLGKFELIFNDITQAFALADSRILSPDKISSSHQGSSKMIDSRGFEINVQGLSTKNLAPEQDPKWGQSKMRNNKNQETSEWMGQPEGFSESNQLDSMVEKETGSASVRNQEEINNQNAKRNIAQFLKKSNDSNLSPSKFGRSQQGRASPGNPNPNNSKSPAGFSSTG